MTDALKKANRFRNTSVLNGRRRTGKQVSLGIVRTQSYEHVLFFLRLHALGDDEDVVFVRVADDMAQQAFVAGVRVDSANVFHVDFDIVRGEVDHSGEVRVVGSEVVDGDLAPERFQLVGDGYHEFALGRVDTFEDFENDPGGTDSEPSNGIADEIHERKVGDVVGGKVYGKLRVRGREVRERLFDHDARNGTEVSSLFRGGEEFSRRDDGNGVRRIEHSDEALHFFLRGSERGVIADFLVKRNEEVFFEGVFHEGYHLEAFAEKRARNEGGIEKHGRFAPFARLVERDVRAHEHFFAFGAVGHDAYRKRKGDSRTFIGDFELVQMRKELRNGFRRRAFGADDGEVGAFQFVRFPTLATEQSRKASSYRDEDVVPHFRTVGVVHLDHVVHVDDRERRVRTVLQVFHELVAVRKTGLEVDGGSQGGSVGMAETLELRDVVADDLERRHLAVFHYRGNDGMKPEQAAVLRLFADVPFPNPSGSDGFPKAFPKTRIMDSGMENGHVFSDELVLGVSRNLEKAAVDREDDAGGIGFDRSFVASEEVDDGKESRLFLADGNDVLLEQDVLERQGKDAVLGKQARNGVADSLDDFL